MAYARMFFPRLLDFWINASQPYGKCIVYLPPSSHCGVGGEYLGKGQKLVAFKFNYLQIPKVMKGGTVKPPIGNVSRA